MKKTSLPATIRRFVEQQTTLPLLELWKHDPKEDRSYYGSYWQRAIVCMLLSGRVKAKMDGAPNMTDVHRIGKEANFNQYLFEQTAILFTAMEMITVDRQDRYQEGSNLDAFWNRDADRLKTAARGALIKLFRGRNGLSPWSKPPAHHAHLIELLVLFFACFKGRAIAATDFGQVLLDFSQLSKAELVELAKTLGEKAAPSIRVVGGRRWT